MRDNFAVMLSRPGNFNDITDGLTFYARTRGSGGALEGILMHDVRRPDAPVTLMAERGQIVDNNGQPQLVVFDGRRQEMNVVTGQLSQIAFDQYVLDLNALHAEGGTARLPDPREQTVDELLNPSPDILARRSSQERLMAEFHQRLAEPLLAFSYTLIGLAAILAGEVNRRGMSRRILLAALAIIAVQAANMAMTSFIARQSWLTFALYLTTFGPAVVGFMLLLNLERVRGLLRFLPSPCAEDRRPMIQHWTLNRYLGRQYVLWFFAFMLALSGIIFLFEVAELLRRAGDKTETTFGLVLRMGIYKMPDTIEHILPFVVLFAGMFTFWRLTRSHELVIARSAGVSAWQFLMPALIITLLFSFFNVTLLNPIGAVFNGKYKKLEAHYLEHVPTLELTGAGLWLRQRDTTRRYLLHADHVDMDPLTLTPLMAFIYDNNDHYLGRIDAPKAVLSDGYWEIQNAWFNWDQQPPQHVDSYQLPTTLTLGKIQESMAPPNTISFWKLPHFIAALKTIGLPPARHELAFQSLLSQPLLLCAMVFFAAAFSLRMERRGGVLAIVIAGVVIGGLMFSLNNVVTALGVNQDLPVALAAWAIPVFALATGNAALLYMEDG